METPQEFINEYMGHKILELQDYIIELQTASINKKVKLKDLKMEINRIYFKTILTPDPLPKIIRHPDNL